MNDSYQPEMRLAFALQQAFFHEMFDLSLNQICQKLTNACINGKVLILDNAEIIAKDLKS